MKHFLDTKLVQLFVKSPVTVLLLLSCTPSIEKMERHDGTMTDSALSVLSTIGKDKVTLVETMTVEGAKTEVRFIEAEPIREVLGMQVFPEGDGGCDTVWIRDTVYVER